MAWRPENGVSVACQRMITSIFMPPSKIKFPISKWGISRLPEDDYLDFYAPQQNQISYQFMPPSKIKFPISYQFLSVNFLSVSSYQ